MKHLIIVIILSLSGFNSFGQKDKYQTDEIKVYGICNMCKERIESALDILGIRKADWNVANQTLELVYNPKKISLMEIHQLCSNVGHSTNKIAANPEAYNNLHHCCKYKDTEVIKNHQK